MTRREIHQQINRTIPGGVSGVLERQKGIPSQICPLCLCDKQVFAAVCKGCKSHLQPGTKVTR